MPSVWVFKIDAWVERKTFLKILGKYYSSNDGNEKNFSPTTVIYWCLAGNFSMNKIEGRKSKNELWSSSDTFPMFIIQSSTSNKNQQIRGPRYDRNVIYLWLSERHNKTHHKLPRISKGITRTKAFSRKFTRDGRSLVRIPALMGYVLTKAS